MYILTHSQKALHILEIFWIFKYIAKAKASRRWAVRSVYTRQLRNCEHYRAARSHGILTFSRGSIRRLQLTGYSRGGNRQIFHWLTQNISLARLFFMSLVRSFVRISTRRLVEFSHREIIFQKLSVRFIRITNVANRHKPAKNFSK